MHLVLNTSKIRSCSQFVCLLLMCSILLSCKSTVLEPKKTQDAPVVAQSNATVIPPVTIEQDALSQLQNPFDILRDLKTLSGQGITTMKPVLAAHGINETLFNWESSYLGQIEPEIEFHSDDLQLFELDMRSTGPSAYALIRLDALGDGIAMIFAKKKQTWEYIDGFKCAEPGYLSNERIAEVELKTLQTGSDLETDFLILRGRRDHGTGRLSVQTDWYNLTARKRSLSYMSVMMALMGDEARWLGYDIRSDEHTVYDNGSLTLTVTYDGALVDERTYQGFNDTPDKSIYYKDRWPVNYTLNSDGTLQTIDAAAARRIWPINLNNPEFNYYTSISPASIMVLFPNMIHDLSTQGSGIQKKWLVKFSKYSS